MGKLQHCRTDWRAETVMANGGWNSPYGLHSRAAWQETRHNGVTRSRIPREHAAEISADIKMSNLCLRPTETALGGSLWRHILLANTSNKSHRLRPPFFSFVSQGQRCQPALNLKMLITLYRYKAVRWGQSFPKREWKTKGNTKKLLLVWKYIQALSLIWRHIGGKNVNAAYFDTHKEQCLQNPFFSFFLLRFSMCVFAVPNGKVFIFHSPC